MKAVIFFASVKPALSTGLSRRTSPMSTSVAFTGLVYSFHTGPP